MDSGSCTHTRAEVLVLNRSVQRLHHRRYYYCCLSAGVGEQARRRAAMRLWELVWSPLQRHLRHGKGRLSPAWQTLQELSVGHRLQAAYGRRAPPPPHQTIDSHIAQIRMRYHLTSTLHKLHAMRIIKYECHQVIGLSMRSASAPRARACLRSSTLRRPGFGSLCDCGFRTADLYIDTASRPSSNFCHRDHGRSCCAGMMQTRMTFLAGFYFVMQNDGTGCGCEQLL